MPYQNLFKRFITKILKKFFAVPQLSSLPAADFNKVLIVRQHNQFGDLLASVSLFRAIKETYPTCKITLIASLDNYFAAAKNEFIDDLFVFDNKKLWNPFYYRRLIKVIKQNFDLAIVPATVAISKTSCIIAAFSDAKVKVGPKSLNGVPNVLSYIFHFPINLNWKKCPDAHVSDFILDIVRPLGIRTRNFSSSISFDEYDEKYPDEFLSSLNSQGGKFIIGFHVGAGKPQNRWSLEKYISVINKLRENYLPNIYFTGSPADMVEINYVKNKLNFNAGYFIDKSIPQLAALISKSDLFITNDTGIMHVAGTTQTPQISIFGPTNPFNWAPIGHQKYFVRKSELINDISEEDVFNLCKYILDKKKNRYE